MKCEDCQEAILVEVIRTKEQVEHLAECDACSAFAKDLELMMGKTTEPVVPKVLDDKILNFARENRPPLHKNKPALPFIILSIAALLLISFSINFLQKQNGAAKPNQVAVVPEVKDLTPDNKIDKVRLQEQNAILENLWGDEDMDTDLLAVEGELFVMSAEIYIQ
jgi:hypothetical protein